MIGEEKVKIGGVLVNRSMLEMALVERTGAHLTPTERIRQEPLSTGIPAVDLLTGGVPRGGITELTGEYLPAGRAWSPPFWPRRPVAVKPLRT